jgi:opacity protein-like surface antigen
VAGSLSTAAEAQNCIFSGSFGNFSNGAQIAASNAAVSAAFGGAISQINTAFIGQQGSAFVSAPADPSPDQPGGGIWVRGVGGEATTKSVSTSTLTNVTPPPGSSPTSVSIATSNCASSQRTDFGGVQVGTDIARLNWGGWNLHVGTTAGYVSARTTGDGFTTNFEVPFIGGYAVATHGRFFADVMVRQDFYNASLSNPSLAIPSTPIGAHGVSVSTSAGYNFALANNWFIEPSAGFIWSNTKVDTFTTAGTFGATEIAAGAVSSSDITSQLGRLSVRAGTTLQSGNVTWQPFGTVSVFHEFAGNTASAFASNSAGLFPAGSPQGTPAIGPTFDTQQTSTTRVGTYGQYSLGLAGQLNHTGWLGFVRVDYRNGSNIEGWAGNAGIRYQFTPEMIASVMPRKAPVKALPVAVTYVNWTGFYVGGFLGGAYGRSDIRFVGDPAGSGNNPWIMGGLGGGQVGYNYQVNNWVLGVEGDLGGTNMSGARTCGNSIGRDPVTLLPTSFSPFLLTCGDRMDWIATAAARVGWANGRVLYYAKAGGAWADETTSIGCVIAPQNNNTTFNNNCRNQAAVITNGFSTSSTRSGWTLGFGTEFDLGKGWSAKGEYDYIDFGSHSALATDGVTVLRTATSLSEVKVGLNYRFVSGAVVANY